MVDINVIIENNLGLVYKQLHRFNLQDDPDSISAGYEALYRAIKTFDESKNFTFSTYATTCIYNALGSVLRTNNKIRKLEVVSYNKSTVGDNGEETEMLDFIPADETVEEVILREELIRKTRTCLDELYESLPSKNQKEILKRWRESDFNKTSVEIAKEMHLSQSYVSMILNELKYKIKQRMMKYYE